MKNYEAKGYINGIAGAISYGMNPLFALPMYSHGYGVNSVLFYRYLFAVVIYGCLLKFFKKTDFRINIKELGLLFVFGIIFSLSSIFLFLAFKYIDSGIACTILFGYPIMVAFISRVFYKERLPKIILAILCMVVLGIYMLYGGKPQGNLNICGVIYVLLSALSYAIYLVGVKHVNTIKHIKPDKLTFYVMLFGLSVYIWNLRFCTQLQMLDGWFVTGCAVMLAIFPTIISLETVTYSVKFIGATKTAILGALEPLTALFFGVLLFGETLSVRIVAGIVMILAGVLVMIMYNNVHKTLTNR